MAVDGADLPAALQEPRMAAVQMGPGETADFIYTPLRPGQAWLEVWITPAGQRIALPVVVRGE